MKRLSIVLALVGLLLGLLLISWFGFDNVVDAVSRVGWTEFAVICACRSCCSSCWAWPGT